MHNHSFLLALCHDCRSLSDTHGRGSLDSSDFSIAMYFIQACMADSALVLPQSLPPSIYEQVSGQPIPAVALKSGGCAEPSPRSSDDSYSNPFRSSVAQIWDISPQEKSVADGFFAEIDTHNAGHIDAEVAVPFLLKSGLSREILARVW